MQTPEVIPSELPPHAQRVLLVEPADRVYFRIQSRTATGLRDRKYCHCRQRSRDRQRGFYDLRVGTHRCASWRCAAEGDDSRRRNAGHRGTA